MPIVLASMLRSLWPNRTSLLSRIGNLPRMKYANSGLLFRDRTILAIRDVRNNIVKRANEAKATEQWMIEKLMREGSDERVLREFSITLKEVPTKELVDYLRYLVHIGDRRALSVRCLLQRETTVRHAMSYHQYEGDSSWKLASEQAAGNSLKRNA